MTADRDLPSVSLLLRALRRRPVGKRRRGRLFCPSVGRTATMATAVAATVATSWSRSSSAAGPSPVFTLGIASSVSRHGRRGQSVAMRGWFDDVTSGFRKDKDSKRLASAEQAIKKSESGSVDADMLLGIRDLLGSQEQTLQTELGALKDQLSTLDSRFQESQGKVKESEEREGLLAKRLTSALELETDLQTALSSVKSEYEKIADDMEMRQVAESNLKGRIQELEKDEKELMAQVDKQQKRIEDLTPLREEKQQLADELARMQAQQNESAEKLSASEATTAKLETALDTAKEQMAGLASELAEARENERKLQGELTEALGREETLTKQLSEAQAKEKELSSELQATLKKLDLSNTQQNVLEGKLEEEMAKAKQLAEDLDKARQMETSLAKDLRTALDEENDLLEKLDKLSDVQR